MLVVKVAQLVEPSFSSSLANTLCAELPNPILFVGDSCLKILWLDGQNVGFDFGIGDRVVVNRLNLEAQLPKVVRDNTAT